jgi:TonB family protein
MFIWDINTQSMKAFYISILALFVFTKSYSQVVHSIKPVEEAKVFTFVDQMPVYPGGDAALMKFVQQHINYPDKERNDSIEGRVFIRFVVDVDGSVKDITVIRSATPGLANEAVRVVKLLARFKPGYSEGKPVRVYFNLPITFRLT